MYTLMYEPRRGPVYPNQHVSAGGRYTSKDLYAQKKIAKRSDDDDDY